MARYLLPRRLWWGACAPLFVTCVLLTVLYVSVSAWSLSGDQAVQRDLGRFAASYNPNPNGQRHADPERYVPVAESLGGVVVVSSPDIGPAVADPPRSAFRETDWSADPFPRRYRLLAGRMPRSPREIAVSEEAQLFASGDRLTVFGGTSLRIVGVVDDRFSVDATILAAPGTWTGLRASAESARPTDAIVSVLVPDAGIGKRVAARLAVVSHALRITASAAAIRATERTAETIAREENRTWLERLPFAFLVPTLLLPMVGGAAVIGVRMARFRRLVRQFAEQGLSMRSATGGLALSAVVVVVAAVGAAIGAGYLVGWAVRPVLTRFATQELSPLPGPGMLFARAGAAASLGALLLVASIRPDDGPRRAPARPRAGISRFVGLIRRLAIVAMAIASVSMAATVPSMTAAMLLVGAAAAIIVLAVPDALDALVSMLPRREHAEILVRVQLTRSRAASGAWVLAIAFLLGMPLALLTMIATAASSQEAALIADAAPDQLLVVGRGGTLAPPGRGVRSALEGQGLGKPIAVGYLGSLDTTVTPPGELGVVYAFDDIGSAETVLSRPFSALQREALERGGMLAWVDLGTATTLDDGRGHRFDVAVEAYWPDPAWQQSASGVMLTATARAGGIQVSRGALVYPDVSAERTVELRSRVAGSGLDPDQLRYARHRSGQLTPTPVILTAIGLLALLVVVSATFAGVRARSSRVFLATLLQLDIPWPWTKRLVLREQVILVGLGVAFAAVLTLTGLGAAMLVLGARSAVLPVLPTVTASCALVMSVAIGSALGLRRVRAAERLM